MSLKHNSCNTLYSLLGFLLDDGPKPSIFFNKLAFLSSSEDMQEYRMGEGKNISIAARRVKTGISFLALGTELCLF